MTKVHITNLYGMAGDSTVILAQNAVTDIARALGYREIGIYFYNISTDSPSERSKRLDGIMASISFGDIVIFQSPTWNGWEFDAEFVAKLKDLRVKLVIFIHDVIPLMFRDNAYLCRLIWRCSIKQMSLLRLHNKWLTVCVKQV